MTGAELEIRECHALEEMRAAVALQKEVWNFSDAELVPLRLFVVAEKVGGQVLGAFAGAIMVGFGLAIPGYRDGRAYLHSHMVAVRAEFRDAGLGRRIKMRQRESALARGFDLIEWTFDPLEIKNAYFNIERLGAVSRRYIENQYGITSSPLQGGLPSDRLIAEWWLKSPRVQRAVAGQLGEQIRAELEIEVPREIYEWKASAELRGKAATVQQRNREQFLHAFECGLVVTGYQRNDDGDGRFLLATCEVELETSTGKEGLRGRVAV